MKLRYYSELDGVRGLAALMVILFHFFQSFSYSGPTFEILKKVSVFGQTGVDLFFVLSGFLITRILLEAKDKENFFSNFYMRRTLRIFPLYYFALILYYFVFPFLNGLSIPEFSQQVYYYVYLQNFSTTFNWAAVGPEHFWSLGVEEHFYLFWPFVVYLLDRKKLTFAIAFLIITAYISRFFMNAEGYPVFYFTLTRFDSLAIGAILANLELDSFLKKQNANKFLIALSLTLILLIMLWTNFGGEGADTIQVVKPLIIATFYFCFLGFLVSSSEHNVFKKIFNLSPLSYTGKISYGLYVYHPFIFTYLSKYIKTDYLALDIFINLVISYAIATLSYYLFEGKIIKLKRYFEYKKEKPALLEVGMAT